MEHSCLAGKPGLDLFSTLPTQASIEEGYHVEHMPTASLNDEGPIKFLISGDSNNYLDLSSRYLLLEVKITKAHGTDLDAQSDAAPINLLGHTLFQ